MICIKLEYAALSIMERSAFCALWAMLNKSIKLTKCCGQERFISDVLNIMSNHGRHALVGDYKSVLSTEV